MVPLQASTSTHLLTGLHDHDNHAVWREFDRRYRPILLGVARRRGLSGADADDVVQDTILKFVEEYRGGRYSRDRGRLRDWLLAILRSHVAGLYRRRDARREQRGDSALAAIASPSWQQAWDLERDRVILLQTLEELRTSGRTQERTLRAFELYVLAEREPREVAAELGMTVADVYVAKNRVAERLRARLQELERLFDDT